jgi:hypothetical protein
MSQKENFKHQFEKISAKVVTTLSDKSHFFMLDNLYYEMK